MTSAAQPIEQLVRAQSAVEPLVAGVREDQWSSPTPCAEWNVRGLVNHLVVGNLLFTALLTEGAPPDRAADHLGDDPVAAYRAAAADVQAAFGLPGVLERRYQVPAGLVPGMVMLHLRITEHLVHGWDLAKATGQPAVLPEDLAEQELAFATGPSAPDVPRTGHPFGPIQPVSPGATPIDRLVAHLGRPITVAGGGTGS